MDYCSSCRRYLNGALVCPGCGGYAPKPVRPSWTPAEDDHPGRRCHPTGH
ncbi:SCO2400 family protein [Streptomyces mirabilis]